MREEVSMQFLSFPQPPNNQEQCNTTVGDRSLLHYSHVSTASKRKKNAHIFKKKKKIIFSNMIKRLDVNYPSLFRLMHFACFSGCLHCPAHSLGSSECKSIMVETKL